MQPSPKEINLRVQRSAVHLVDDCGVTETVHFIDGETLRAAYEAWQEYRRIERELLDQSRAAISDKKDGDDGLNSLSAPERAWLEWFYSLSEEDRKIVEICGEKGISVTPTNFEQMKVLDFLGKSI